MQPLAFQALAKKELEKKLEELFPATSQDPLVLSARYSLLAPGKRLRPLFLIATAASFHTPIEKSLIAACALEMIHTYSLIHDDLPCMDDDDLRRGRPSLHKAFPEWHALLTGDYLLTYAFELLAHSPGNAEENIALIQIVSREAGLDGMLGGQMIDLLSTDKEISLSLLKEMHLKKTASLLITALECGAVLGNSSKKDRQILKTVGAQLGLSYQLIDDLLDVTQNTEELGKPAFSDKKNKKATAVSILGIPATLTQLQELKLSIESLLNSLSCSPLLLHHLCDGIFTNIKKII